MEKTSIMSSVRPSYVSSFNCCFYFPVATKDYNDYIVTTLHCVECGHNVDQWPSAEDDNPSHTKQECQAPKLVRLIQWTDKFSSVMTPFYQKQFQYLTTTQNTSKMNRVVAMNFG